MMPMEPGLGEILAFHIANEARPGEMQKVRDDKAHTFAASGGRDHHSMGEAVGRGHGEERVGVPAAELTEDETVLVETADQLVGLRLEPRLEMRIIKLVQPSAMHTSQPDQGEGNRCGAGVNRRALPRCPKLPGQLPRSVSAARLRSRRVTAFR